MLSSSVVRDFRVENFDIGSSSRVWEGTYLAGLGFRVERAYLETGISGWFELSFRERRCGIGFGVLRARVPFCMGGDNPKPYILSPKIKILNLKP